MTTNTLSTMFAVRPHNLVPVKPESPDADLLKTWNERQLLLATIEGRGRFFDSETHSPAETEAFDEAETKLIASSAKTLEGVQVKLWDAFSHVGGPVCTDEARAKSDTMRRCDFHAVMQFAHELDCDQMALLQIIADVADLTKTPAFGAVDL